MATLQRGRKYDLTDPNTLAAEIDRSFNTWSKGNPHLAQVLPKSEPLLAPGQKFIHEDGVESDLADAKDERNPHHPDNGLKPVTPMRDLIDPNDAAFEHYRPWRGGYAPALKFFLQSKNQQSTSSPTLTNNDISNLHNLHELERVSSRSSKTKSSKKRQRKTDPSSDFKSDTGSAALQTRSRKK